MRRELDVSEEQVVRDLREALGIPDPADVWEHDSNTFTISDLKKLCNISDTSARRAVAEALEKGTMVEGQVHSATGHYVAAYRMVHDE